MKRNKFSLQILTFGLIVISFIACDKDFVNIQSDIINNDNATNFDIFSTPLDIITYTQALAPVETSNLGLNTLGSYDDVFGRTTSSFVSQVTLSTFNPVFGEEVAIDSVVLDVPYFSRVTDLEESGNILYDIDSVIGRNPLKLSIFESDYFIRNFDPNGDFNESQSYFSNKSASANEMISDAALESEELIFLRGKGTSYPIDPVAGENVITVSDEGFTLITLDEEGVEQVSLRQPPGIRIKLDPAYWQNKIIDQEGESVLGSANSFENYFKGLYFKAETVGPDGSFLTLNLGSQSSLITIYYTRLTPSETDDVGTTEQTTFQVRFSSNRINFMANDFTTPISDGNEVDGDSRLYLKGGEGSMVKIKLFNGDGINDGDDATFDDFKSLYVVTENGIVRSKRLINEANLVFYVDQDVMQNGEPNRLYLYDAENKTPLIDYFLDAQNASLPSFSVVNHLGPLQRVDDDPLQSGIKYKFRITEHLNNLLLRDSTNVELGLSVSLNVNLEGGNQQREVQSPSNSGLTVPISAILTPRGTVLHGNTLENGDKKVFLEIYYTCLDGDDECNQN
jgi:hypothetical protein